MEPRERPRANGINSGGCVDRIVRQVHAACKAIDAECQVTFVGLDDEQRTQVRIRAGGGTSVGTLQRTLSRQMPFARVRARESVLDATLEAQITLPSRADECRLARARVTRQPTLWALRVLALLTLLSALVTYAMQIIVHHAQLAPAAPELIIVEDITG